MMTVTIDAGEWLGQLEGDLERLAAACAHGLALGARAAADQVWPAARAAGLDQRTGLLGQSVQDWQPGEDPLERLIGVPEGSPAAKYAYLLGAEDVTIRPIGHKFLAIPIGENVTGAGVGGRLYGSPREIPEALVAWVGRTVGVRDAAGDYEPLFALVEEVTVFGRDVLGPTVEAEAPAIRKQVAAAITEQLQWRR